MYLRYYLDAEGKPDNDWLGYKKVRVPDSASVPGEWPVSYHGTGVKAAGKIAELGYQLKQGFRFHFGKGVYSSPDPAVAEKFAFRTTEKETGKQFKIIFQNRVRPGSYRRIGQEETGHGDYFLSADPQDIRPYGTCIKPVLP